MKRSTCVLLPVLVVAFLGCDRMLHRVHKTVYAPMSTGLTLIYEDPALPKGPDNRFQVRVVSSKETADGTLVRVTYTTLQGQTELLNRIKDGGRTLIMEDNRTLVLLPEGFPDRVFKWESPAGSARVIGRGSVDLPGLVLPADYDRIGVWVQFDGVAGSSRRVFYMAEIGEAETLTLRDGQWVCTNRLVSRGFTDVPVLSS